MAGKSGEKMAPVGPSVLSSPGGPATPESPEERKRETPCMPSFMYSLHWRCWYDAGGRQSVEVRGVLKEGKREEQQRKKKKGKKKERRMIEDGGEINHEESLGKN